MTRAAVALCLLAACADRPLPDNAASMESGGSSGNGGSGGSGGGGGMGGTSGSGGTGGSGGMLPDASERIDAARRDAGGSASCGQIVLCAFQCGQDLTCVQNCCAMGTQQACQQAQGLLICAVTSCSSSLGNPTQLFQCLQMHCSTQLQSCTGL